MIDPAKAVSEAMVKAVSQAMAQSAPQDRGRMLTEFLTLVVGALVIVKGRERAAEDVYRLADIIVAKETK